MIPKQQTHFELLSSVMGFPVCIFKGRLAKKASQNKELEGESAEFEEKTGKSIQSMGGDGNDL